MAVFSMVSSKGGAGKTTAAVLLATEIARENKTVVIIDADPNQPLVRWSGLPAGLPDNIAVMADQRGFFCLQSVCTGSIARFRRQPRSLRLSRLCYDYVRARRLRTKGVVMIRFLALSFATIALLATPPIQAQSATEGADFLEEILVTARKREENVLQIAESVSVLGATTIERANINGLEDIGLLVPNLNMSRRADGFPNVSIRGLGGFGNTQGVGFYLDDVQLFSDASSRFGDLERVEVLKGPQGVLFGGANIGGAVKFVTARPDPTGFSGSARLRAGEDNLLEGELTLNAPLSDDWAMRLFAFTSSDDGFLTNTNAARQNGGTGDQKSDIGEVDETGIRATLAGDFSDTVSMYATVRFNDFDGPNNTWSIEPDGDLEYPTDIDYSVNGRHEKETFAASVELNFELDSGDITYLGSITNTDSDRLTDLDTTNEYVLDFFRPHELDVLTQELRFSSDDDGPLRWQVGAYYLNYERDIRTDLIVLGGFGFFDPTVGIPVPPLLDPFETAVLVALPWEYSARERTQTAFFGDFTYRAGQVEFSAGVRFDDWKSDRCVDWTAGVENSPAFCGSQSETETLGRASVAWFTDDDKGMFYGTISQGFEPGDFNLNNRPGETSPLAFGPENVTQFEGGYKGRLNNDRVIFEVAAFLINYENRQFELQENDPVTGGFTEGIVNAGDSEHTGFEVDVLANLNDNWTLSAGVGWVSAKWDSGTTSPVTGAGLSGDTPPNTADFSGALALDFDMDLGSDRGVFGRLQIRHRADSSTNAQWFDAPGDDFPFWDNPSYTVVDLNVGYEMNNWSFDLMFENLTDEKYYIDVQEFPNFAGSARAGTPGLIVIGTAEQRRRTIFSVSYAF